ncbi:MAG: tetratricopeptide repeat protein [Candidatus Omnitrophica bacterium]|nr:tetratricopeptide repeat protein [Candidatus Omnitrophota bacterium]
MLKNVMSLFFVNILIFSFIPLTFGRTNSHINNIDITTFLSKKVTTSYIIMSTPLLNKKKESSEQDSNPEEEIAYRPYIQKSSQYAYKKQYSKAEKELKNGLVLYNTNSELQVTLNMIKDMKSRIIAPSHASYLSKGFYYIENNNYEKAIFYFLKAKRINPNYPFTYLCLGISYFQLKQYNKAEKNLIKAKKIFAYNKENHGIKVAEKYLFKIP